MTLTPRTVWQGSLVVQTISNQMLSYKSGDLIKILQRIYRGTKTSPAQTTLYQSKVSVMRLT